MQTISYFKHFNRIFTIIAAVALCSLSAWAEVPTLSQLDFGTPIVDEDFSTATIQTITGGSSEVANLSGFGVFNKQWTSKNASDNTWKSITDTTSAFSSNKCMLLHSYGNYANGVFISGTTFGTVGAWRLKTTKSSYGEFGIYGIANGTYATGQTRVYLRNNKGTLQIFNAGSSGLLTIGTFTSTEIIDICVIYNKTNSATTYGGHPEGFLPAGKIHIYVNGTAIPTNASDDTPKPFPMNSDALDANTVFKVRSYEGSGANNYLYLDDLQIWNELPTEAAACSNLVDITKGTPSHGSFSIDLSGEQESCNGLTVTLSDIEADEHYIFDEITQTGIDEGVTIDNEAKTVTYAANTSGSSTINVTFKPIPAYTVSFSTGENNTSVGDITEDSGEAGITLPSCPTPSCSGDGWSFAGWCATNIEEKTDVEPTLLDAGDKYYPTNNCTLYAVYQYNKPGLVFKEYIAVESAPSDWSGKYLLSTGTYTATGAFGSNDLTCDEFTPGETEATAREFELAKIANTDDYSIKLPSKNYLGYNTSGTDLISSASAPTSGDTDAAKKYRWTPGVNCIANVQTTGRRIAAENATPPTKFKAYDSGFGSTYAAVYLYKRTEKDGYIPQYMSNPCATIDVTGVTVDPTSKVIVTGETFTITPTVAPSNATDKTVSWETDHSDIASVISAGVVTGEASGTATITCTTTDGSFTDDCEVIVYDVTLVRVDENGDELTGDGLPSLTRNGVNISTSNVGTLYKHWKWVVTNATLSSSSLNPSITNPTGDVTVTAYYYSPRTVTWIVNGEVYTTGSPTTAVQREKKWSDLTLPSNPTAPCGDNFMGWSTTDISANGGADVTEADDIAALDLMTSENKSLKILNNYKINNNITFYAVFADEVASENTNYRTRCHKEIPAGASDFFWDDFGSAAPTLNDSVYIAQNTYVNVTTAKAKKITLADGVTLTISGGEALQVAEGITMADGSVPTANDLTLGSSVENGNATLIYDISEGLNATVQMASKATTTGGSWTWQYVGVPVAGVAENLYSNGYMYKWNNGWNEVGAKDDLVPFAGYCVSYDGAGHVFEMGGALTTTTAKTIDVAANSAQVIGNSWTAPIQIKQMDADDFTNVTQTIYLYNTGYDPNGEAGEAGAGNRYEGNTYVVIPIAETASVGISKISALQGFFVKNNTESDGSVTLDYAKHIRPTGSHTIDNGPMHAPKRTAEEEMPVVAKLTVSGTHFDDQVILIERENCTNGYDAGHDGEKIGSSSVSPWIYALREDGTHDAVSATNNFEGTVLGFRKGEDSQYTMSFDYNGEEVWYLNDVKAEQATLIDAANTYTFTATENDAARFIISQTPIQEVPTGIDDANNDNGARVRKQVIDGVLYIVRDGNIFNAQGAKVK